MTADTHDRSLSPFLKFDEHGQPYLEGAKCSSCAEVMTGEHRACPKCGAIGSLEPVRLAGTGKLYAYTIVHRSFPGVKTPILSATIRLDDGAFVRGNLEEIEPDPAVIAFDMPVRVKFDYIEKPDGGDRLVRPVFVPAAQGAGHE